jgi:superfamily II DNA or RNA helicase
MQVVVSNTISIENPGNEAILWCNKHLTLSNPEYAKKARMHFWLGDTPAKLTLYEKRGDSLVLPFGVLRRLPEFVSEDVVYKGDFADATLIDYGDDVPLYHYQEKAVDDVFISKYGILQSPAGSGKTQMGIALVKKFGKRALWLTHTLDLLKQSKSRAESYMNRNLIGTITEGKVSIGNGITFATIQTMCKLDLAQYKDFWDVIIVDECHRCAGTPTSMTQFYKVLNALSARHKIGLSATVHRSDGLIAATHALLGEIVYTVPEEAVGDRIMKVGIQPISTGVEITRGCLNTDGTLNYTKLITYLCENEERNNFIVSWIEHEEGRSALILSDRLKHLQDMIAKLPSRMKEQAVMISGKMTTKKGKTEREQAIEGMRTGRKTYLFATYSLAKEGLAIPRLERLFMATPQKDYAVVTQSIGRIARTYKGKADPVAYDFVDNIPYLVKSYKKRCTTYRKNGCYFVEEGET